VRTRGIRPQSGQDRSHGHMSAAGQSRPQPPPPQPRTSSVSSGFFQVEVASDRKGCEDKLGRAPGTVGHHAASASALPNKAVLRSRRRAVRAVGCHGPDLRLFSRASRARLWRARPPGPSRDEGKSAGIIEGQRWTAEGSAAGGLAGLAGSLAAAGRRPGPLPLRWGRTARAAAAAPFPRTRRPPGHPSVTQPPASAPARTAWASSPRRAILSPGNLAVKGATDGRVPPLHSGQTLDCELSRQDQRLSGGREEVRAVSPAPQRGD
jgi:hypothetical protein